MTAPALISPLPVVLAFALTLAAPPARASVLWLLETVQPALRADETRRLELERRLSELGPGAEAPRTPELGFQLYPVNAPPLVPPWVQLDLGAEHALDRLALVPAPQPDAVSQRAAYGFPRRFRVDLASEPEFREPVTVADFTAADVGHDGPEPFVVEAAGRRARYVRLTVTALAPRGNHLFFALGEIVALAGNRNVALGARVAASDPRDLPPAWRAANLTDGRISLGPPVRAAADPHATAQNGITASSPDPAAPAVMAVDTGAVRPWEEVRLFAMHSSVFGTPGLRFPESLLVEAATEETFAAPHVLLDTRARPLAHGGDPLVVRVPEISARFLRLTGRAAGAGRTPRFSLSEIQIYSGGTNVARGAPAQALPVHNPVYRTAADLTDGRTSLGEIVELPAWLEAWRERGALRHELAQLAARRTALVAAAERRLAWTGGALATVVLAVAAALLLAARVRRRRALAELRDRLARDLHDEIGSNLAGIAMLSDVAARNAGHDPAARDEWRDVQRIAQETTGAMREVLWLMGAREEAGVPFARQLELTAARLLRGHEIVWTAPPAEAPAGWPVEDRRSFLLTFKEALANVVRHAGATRVELTVRLDAGAFVAEIRDNGRGFPAPPVAPGLGLRSIAARMRRLGGTVRNDNHPAGGARVVLRVPAPSAA